MRSSVVSCILFFTLTVSVHGWFAVPMGYWDKYDGWTPYFAIGFGDTTKYAAAELRYSPHSEAIRSELTLALPLFGIGTELRTTFLRASTYDPRKVEIFVPISEDSVSAITTPEQDAEEINVRIHQRYKAGIESFWGIFAQYSYGRYFSDYKLTAPTFTEEPETTSARYVGGGLSFGYDTRHGDMDPIEAGYYFSIESGLDYLIDDTSEADYVSSTVSAPKIVGFIYIDQYIYTPTSALPVEIPLLTVQAPTVIAVRTSGAYYTSEVPQLLAIKGGDFNLFRGLPPRRLAGYAYFILAADIRISPIVRMYTPITPLHLLAPRIIPDVRADVEFIPSIDIGKIFGAQPEEQFYTWGMGIGMKFTKRLTARLDFLWTPKFNNYLTTYFVIRQPF